MVSITGPSRVQATPAQNEVAKPKPNACSAGQAVSLLLNSFSEPNREQSREDIKHRSALNWAYQQPRHKQPGGTLPVFGASLLGNGRVPSGYVLPQKVNEEVGTACRDGSPYVETPEAGRVQLYSDLNPPLSGLLDGHLRGLTGTSSNEEQG